MRRYAAAINLHTADLPKLEGYGREEETLPNPELHLPCVLHQPHTVLDEIRSARFENPIPEGFENPVPGNITTKIPLLTRVHSEVAIFRNHKQAATALASWQTPTALRCAEKDGQQLGARGPLVQSKFAVRPLTVAGVTGIRIQESHAYLANRGNEPPDRQPALAIDMLAFTNGPALIELVYSHEPSQHVSGEEQRLLTLLQHRAATARL